MDDLTKDSQLNQIVDDFLYAYASKILDTGHNASGNLIQTMKKNIEYDGKFFSVTLTVPMYAIYLEEGTKPHFPPIEAILKWIKVKTVLPRMQNGKLPTEKQLAYLISRKISREGTPATHLLKDTLTEFQFREKILTALKEAINRAL